jgi:hypothetical protein
MLPLSQLDPHSLKTFRYFFAIRGDSGTTFSGRLIARARLPERERAPPHPAGLQRPFPASARLASVALTCICQSPRKFH